MSSTSNSPLVAIPVKAFGVAKARLAPRVSAPARRVLGQAMAARTARMFAEAGAEPVILAADARVAGWARTTGFEVLAQRRPGLNGAALDLVESAAGPWMMVHADLPLITSDDARIVLDALEAGPVISPARDGGTNVLGARHPGMDFAYGPGSFHHHLRNLSDHVERPTVIVRIGLALDLDTPEDLVYAIEASPWLRDLIAAF